VICSWLWVTFGSNLLTRASTASAFWVMPLDDWPAAGFSDTELG